MNEIYLDSAASYPPRDQLKTIHCNWQANPNSLHMRGSRARSMIMETERVLRKKLSVKDGAFYWTGSGSEANRLTIEYFCEKGGLVTSNLEHKSIRQLTRKYGNSAEATEDGSINYNSLENLCNKDTQLISVMLANNETGVINIDPQLARDSRAPDALFHTDISQAFCKYEVKASDYDLVTFSAHKIGGPKGLGCLWVSEHLKKELPYLGTPNPEAINAFQFAVESFPNIEKYTEHIEKLESILLQRLEGFQINSGAARRIPGILSIAFVDPYIDATELMMILTSKGVHLSTGAACNNKLGERSHVLLAMGLPLERIDSSVRISLSHYLTEEEIKEAAKIISETVKELRDNGS